MKLASLKNGSRDGLLVVVDRKLATCVKVPQISQTLQQAIETWDTIAPKLQAIYDQLNEGGAAGAEAFAPERAESPCPALISSSTARFISVTCAKRARRAVPRCLRISRPSR